MKEKLKVLSKSNLFYLPFKVLEGLIGVLSLSLYTRLFGKEIYGSYNIINTSVALISILSIGWLRFVTTRYIKEYNAGGRRKIFISSVFYAYIISILIGGLVLIANIFLVVKQPSMFALSFYLLFYLGYTFSQLFVDLLLYDDKRMMNILIITATAILKPLLVYYLHKLRFDPYLAIVAGCAAVDLVFGLYALRLMRFGSYIDLSLIDKKLVVEFVKYGFALIGLSITIYLLNAADKFVILHFWGDGAVGIYAANYAIASSSFTLLTLGLSKGFYPNLLSKWTSGNKVEAESVLSRALQNYLFLAVPAALGLCFVSYDMANLLFGEEYMVGYGVIGISTLGMFFFGLSEYFNKGFELKKDTFEITKNSTVAAILNLILNFIFIPFFGFIAAAYTSLASFAAYALICYIRREKSVNFYVNRVFLLKLSVVNLLMSALLTIIILFMNSGLLRLGVLILTGMLSYAIFSLILLRRELFS